MRLSDTVEEARFRAEVREFLQNELPAELRRKPSEILQGELSGGGIEARGRLEARAGGVGFQLLSGAPAEWRRKLTERGWVAPSWPKEYGGAGLTLVEQLILNEEFAEAGAPQMTGDMGISMVGPTLILYGSEEQRAEHLPKILRGEALWCQGFSEPGSGSDLASLQARAVRDGDDFVINGQKIWTSHAHVASWMFMLARTDPEAPKHRGITYFLADLTSPGITIQPLVNVAEMHAFNQVFFEDVRVPAKNVVGEVNRGWYVAAATLDFERSGIGTSVGIGRGVEGLIEWAREAGNVESGQSTLARNPALRYELVDRYVEAQVARMLSYRVVYLQTIGQVPNAEASMAKLFQTELSQRVYRTAMRAIGLYGLVWDKGSAYAPQRAQYSRSYVQSLGATIAGGTSEIQRNIIAQRGLGMPRD